MASVLHSVAIPLSHRPLLSAVSPSNSPSTSSPIAISRIQISCRRGAVCRSASGGVTYIEPSESKKATEEYIRSVKLKLLSVVSGLNRGLAATEEDMKNADAIATELESAAGLVDLSLNIDKLQGRWRLIYSTEFSSRPVRNSQPGPPTGRLLPITIGQVCQRIDVFTKDFDNIVHLELGAPWPLPPAEVTATLAYKFEVIGTSRIRITSEKWTVKPTGNLSQLPPLEVPRLPDFLRPQPDTPGEFDVTYMDSDMRITRGDKGQLRVFVTFY